MLKNSNSRRSANGFTLIELLTVIAIIGILAAILIPVVGSVRESANRAKCGSNVRMLVQACHIFAEETGRFPPTEGNNPPGPPPGPQTNWILILEDGGYTSKVIGYGEGGEETLWFCPTAVRLRETTSGNANSYSMNWQTGSWFGEVGNAGTPDRATEATQTAMIMDGRWDGTQWHPNIGRATGDTNMPDFVHPPNDAGTASAGVNVAFVDGHVEFRKKGDGTGNDDVPTDLNDVFWSGVLTD